MTNLRLGLYAKLEAKPGKEEELAQFLDAGLAMANREERTLVWFAVRFDESTFAIFDAFADEEGRTAHADGPIAAALMAKASELLVSTPRIEPYDVLGAKMPD